MMKPKLSIVLFDNWLRRMMVIFVSGILLLTAAAQECPVPPTSIFGGACVEACDSDTDCTNGQICCGNGCGHECMTPVVDPCAAVRCATPNCSGWSAGTITPEGECCSVCACTTTDGSMVAAGTSFMNDCNTCACLDNGAAVCTLIACVSTTAPSNDTTMLPTSSPMTCPDASGLSGTCDEECSSNDECSNGQLCCSNGCGHDCMNPVVDCTSITCLRPDCDPPGVLFTPSGSCCPICAIIAIPDTAYTPETTELPTDNLPVRTCPTLESNNENNCVTVDDECSSNDDCQYNRICCSNGCGGHVCSDAAEMCQVVRCAWPTCTDGVEPETSPFRCCPFCPSEGVTDDDDGGTGVITIASVMIVIVCCFLTFLL